MRFRCVRWRWPAPLRRKATTRGIDPNQGLSLVEVDVASKAAAMRLQLEAESYGVEFNDHYLRSNPDGSFTVTVFGDEDGLAELHAAGYDLGVTIEGPDTWRARVAERQRVVKAGGPCGPGGAGRRRRRAVTRGRDRRPPGRLLRELRRALPLGRGEGSARQCDADRLDLRRAGAFLSWNKGAGTPIDPRRGR